MTNEEKPNKTFGRMPLIGLVDPLTIIKSHTTSLTEIEEASFNETNKKLRENALNILLEGTPKIKSYSNGNSNIPKLKYSDSMFKYIDSDYFKI